MHVMMNLFLPQAQYLTISAFENQKTDGTKFGRHRN